jgi:hypothetical protein
MIARGTQRGIRRSSLPLFDGSEDDEVVSVTVVRLLAEKSQKARRCSPYFLARLTHGFGI